MKSEFKIIDIHTHGINSLDTRSGDPEVILKIARIQGMAGVSRILLSIYPAPIEVMRRNMEAVKIAMERQQVSVAGEKSAHILGIHLEGPFLNPIYAGALDAASFLPASELLFRQLIEGYEAVVQVITIAPEMEGAIPLIKNITKAGIRVSMGHSNATYAEAEEGWRAGACAVTHLFNAMRGFHHREPGLAGFGLLNPDIYIEVIGDLNHVGKEALDLIFRMKRSDKVLLVSDSVCETRLDDCGPVLHGANRLLGGALLIPQAIELLISKGFDKDVVLQSATVNPRDFLGAA